MAKLTRNAVQCKGCNRVIEVHRRKETKEHHCDKDRTIRFSISGGLDKAVRTIITLAHGKTGKGGIASDNFTDLAS